MESQGSSRPPEREPGKLSKGQPRELRPQEREPGKLRQPALRRMPLSSEKRKPCTTIREDKKAYKADKKGKKMDARVRMADAFPAHGLRMQF